MTNDESLIGKIISTDLQKRLIVIQDKDRVDHGYHVMPEIDYVLRKQKPGWFVKVTYAGDVCKRIDFANKPADWPQSHKAFQKPRNEKLIVVQALIKAWTDLYINSMNPEQIEFNEGRNAILAAVKEDVDIVMGMGEQK